jgi:dTDP-glucose 4,6-dehydratase
MDLKGKKVLVTGGGGFIGSHLTETLVKSGSHVRAFLHYNSRNDNGFIKEFPSKIKEQVDIFYGDIRELATVRQAIRDIDVVFNLAALVGIPYSYKNPQEVVGTNTIGTLNVLIAAKDEEIKKVIQTSTSEVYGSAAYVPIDEKHPLQPQSPYAASKIGSDSLALSFFLSYDLPVSIIRPFNTYGPRQSARAVIPVIITQALTRKKIRLGNLYPTRDFTYVSDTVDGFIKIAASDKSIGEVINIGSGTEISIGDLVKTILEILGEEVEIKTDSIRERPGKSEVSRLCVDNQKAKDLIGWVPKVKLEEGLHKTIEYITQNINLYNLKRYII